MSYETGQITSNAEPASEVIARIEALLTAHPAWEFVKEVVISTITYRIWRNLGTQNAWGQDFYISLRKATAAGQTTFYVECFEYFDSATDQVMRPCVNPMSTYTPAADGSISTTATYPLNSTVINSFLDIATYTTDFNYWIVATANGLFVNTSAATYPAYAGLFEPMHNHPNEFPLVAWEMGNPDIDGAGSFSRRPGVTVSMLDAFALYSHYAANATAWTLVEGSIPDGIGALYNGKALGSRFAVRNTTITEGAYRGWMYNVLIFPVSTGVAQGDTIIVEGVTYVYFGNSLWVNTAAA